MTRAGEGGRPGLRSEREVMAASATSLTDDVSMQMFSVGRGLRVGEKFSASVNLFKHGWSEIGKGVYLPEVFNVQFESENDHSVQMEIAVVGGTVVCNSIRVVRHPRGAALGGGELRRLPIDEWITHACSMVAVGNQGGIKSTEGEWQSDEYRKDMETVARAAKRTNRGATPERLREVARIYKANNNSAPVQAVKEAMHVEYSTAARYVKLARDAGLLAPTTPGKVSRG